MPADLRIDKPADAAPVHDWLYWLAWCFADQARRSGDAYLAPDELLGIVETILGLGDRSLRQHIALRQAGIVPDCTVDAGGNVAVLPIIAAERCRRAIASLAADKSPTPPNGGSAA
jgi:hypothetical protein